MVSNLLAVAIGLVAWSLLSYTYPNLKISQFPLGDTFWHSRERNVITPRLATFIEHTLALETITGLSTAVVVVPKHGGGAPEYHAWGHRTEDGDLVAPDTSFRMASVSKAFCATALGLLMGDFESGRNVTALPPGVTGLTWHTLLRDVLPDDWALMDEWASERANFRDVLAHVSGLPRHDAAYGPEDTPLDMIVRSKHLRPAFELRERWSYNNIMYMVVAHVIATYAGQSYTSFVEERIFAPLGMTSSTFSPAKAGATGKFTQGWTKEGRRVPECFTEEAALALAGPGGVISDAVDMAKWISTWINEGVHDNQTVIPASVYRNVSYSYSVSTDHPTDPEHSVVGYGLGWFRASYRGHDVVYHSGSLPGLSTLVSFLPNDKIGVTLFANGENKAEVLTLILNRILDSALHLPTPLARTSPPSRNVTQSEPHARDAVLSLSLDAFAGTYANPGYGSFTLCSPSSTSAYCAKVQSDFAIVDDAQGVPRVSESGSGDLVAAWPRVWSSHVRMRHQRDLVFDLYLPTLYPNGYGKDTAPFETEGVGPAEAVAEFVVAEEGRVVGFGVSGLVGQLTERARTYEGVRDRAEVWFDRV